MELPPERGAGQLAKGGRRCHLGGERNAAPCCGLRHGQGRDDRQRGGKGLHLGFILTREPWDQHARTGPVRSTAPRTRIPTSASAPPSGRAAPSTRPSRRPSRLVQGVSRPGCRSARNTLALMASTSGPGRFARARLDLESRRGCRCPGCRCPGCRWPGRRSRVGQSVPAAWPGGWGAGRAAP